VSDITFEPNEQAVDDLDSLFDSVGPQPTDDPEFDQAEFDAMIAELANGGAPETTYDLSGLYLEGDPDLTTLDTQEAEVDPQAVEAWLDSLEPTQSFDMDL
jgi:hypothetical protein